MVIFESLSFVRNLKQRSVVRYSQHHAANERDRPTTVGEEHVVKVLPGVSAATGGSAIVAQFPDHELSHGVVQVSGIKRVAIGLRLGVALRTEPLVHEHLF